MQQKPSTIAKDSTSEVKQVVLLCDSSNRCAISISQDNKLIINRLERKVITEKWHKKNGSLLRETQRKQQGTRK